MMTKISAARLNMEGGRIDNPILKAYGEKAVTATVGSTYTVDTTAGNVFYLTLVANCTFTFPSTLTSGVAYSFTLMLKQDGGTRTVTWPSSVNWPGSSAPVLSATAGATDAFSFVTINGGTTWLGVAGGLNFGAAAAATSYTLFAWGLGTSGQLGMAEIVSRSVPAQVGTLTTWSTIATGSNISAVLKSDNTLWGWGENTTLAGILGLGDTVKRSSPVQVGGMITWSTAVRGYYHSLSTKSDGALWAWGKNNFGQAGFGDVISRSSPVQVGTLTTWANIAEGGLTSVAIKTDGTMWSWGRGSDGELGLSDAVHRSSPVQIGTLATWSSLVGGGYEHSAAIKNDGTLWSWGKSQYGQLGMGDVVKRSSPVQIGTLATWSAVAKGNVHTVALKTDGTLWGWGRSQYGELGMSDAVSRSSPVQIGTLATWSAITARRFHSAALKSDNTVWIWGRNNNGQLGLGDATNRSSPVQVGGGAAWQSISAGYYHTLALQDPSLLANSQLFSWGKNDSGQLGQADIINRSSPVQIGTLTTWANLSAGYTHSSALKTDGTLWVWGGNSLGQLGQKDTIRRSSPVQVGALATWMQVAVGGKHTLTLKTDGTLWVWGYDNNGELGLGSQNGHRSSPVQVGTLTTWVQITGGTGHSLAIKNNGTLWAWGRNQFGELGLGDSYVSEGVFANRSSPVQVGTLATWAQILGKQLATAALKTDGTLWAWGYNYKGKLGLGNTTNFSSPVQVGTLATWSKVGGSNENFFGIKTDGTLWVWGGNAHGRLGQGDAVNRSSPVQVGTLATWAQIGGGVFHAVALKTDGTLWQWGQNNVGQLGLSDIASRSSPVQVGTFATWTAIVNGDGSYSGPALLWPPTTTTTVPGKPTNVIATVGSASGTAVVVWTAPMSSGGKPISQYTVTSSPGGITATTNGTFATVSGLTPTTSYTFTVTATNSVGTSSASEASNAVVAP